jgi:hypothetical protein
MYYVIQRYHNNHKKHYFAYAVTKYISAKNTQNIIFEINQNGTMKRKWSPKDDIILLTADKELFRTTYERLEALKEQHITKIEAVQEKLDHELDDFRDSMQQEFDLIKRSTQSDTAH